MIYILAISYSQRDAFGTAIDHQLIFEAKYNHDIHPGYWLSAIDHQPLFEAKYNLHDINPGYWLSAIDHQPLFVAIDHQPLFVVKT